LQVEREGDGIDGARKLDEDAVAQEFDDASGVLSHERLDHRCPPLLQARERAGLIVGEKPRIADHIGNDDGCESAGHA
jgi:hypothetical protein